MAETFNDRVAALIFWIIVVGYLIELLADEQEEVSQVCF